MLTSSKNSKQKKLENLISELEELKRLQITELTSDLFKDLKTVTGRQLESSKGIELRQLIQLQDATLNSQLDADLTGRNVLSQTLLAALMAVVDDELEKLKLKLPLEYLLQLCACHGTDWAIPELERRWKSKQALFKTPKDSDLSKLISLLRTRSVDCDLLKALQHVTGPQFETSQGIELRRLIRLQNTTLNSQLDADLDGNKVLSQTVIAALMAVVHDELEKLKLKLPLEYLLQLYSCLPSGWAICELKRRWKGRSFSVLLSLCTVPLDAVLSSLQKDDLPGSSLQGPIGVSIRKRITLHNTDLNAQLDKDLVGAAFLSAQLEDTLIEVTPGDLDFGRLKLKLPDEHLHQLYCSRKSPQHTREWAGAELIRRWARALANQVNRAGIPEIPQAENVLQEIWLSVFNTGPGRFKHLPGQRFYSWLSSVRESKITNYFRAGRPRPTKLERLGIMLQTQPVIFKSLYELKMRGIRNDSKLPTSKALEKEHNITVSDAVLKVLQELGTLDASELATSDGMTFRRSIALSDATLHSKLNQDLGGKESLGESLCTTVLALTGPDLEQVKLKLPDEHLYQLYVSTIGTENRDWALDELQRRWRAPLRAGLLYRKELKADWCSLSPLQRKSVNQEETNIWNKVIGTKGRDTQFRSGQHQRFSDWFKSFWPQGDRPQKADPRQNKGKTMTPVALISLDKVLEEGTEVIRCPLQPFEERMERALLRESIVQYIQQFPKEEVRMVLMLRLVHELTFKEIAEKCTPKNASLQYDENWASSRYTTGVRWLRKRLCPPPIKKKGERISTQEGSHGKH